MSYCVPLTPIHCLYLFCHAMGWDSGSIASFLTAPAWGMACPQTTAVYSSHSKNSHPRTSILHNTYKMRPGDGVHDTSNPLDMLGLAAECGRAIPCQAKLHILACQGCRKSRHQNMNTLDCAIFKELYNEPGFTFRFKVLSSGALLEGRGAKLPKSAVLPYWLLNTNIDRAMHNCSH